jgi:hypothetical protein
MKKLFHILVVSFLFPHGTVQGKEQGSSNGQPYIHLIYYQGVHWNRTQYLDEQLAEGFRGVEARIGFQTNGSEPWQQIHRYPKYGFGIHYADQVMNRSDTTMGNPFSAFAFYNAPITRFGRFSLNTNVSVGLSYMSPIYDPETNPYNDIVASHINMYFDFDLNLIVKLSERIDLTAGYGVTHYSNGNIHEPQKGLNNWGWNLGVSGVFGGGEKPFKRTEFLHNELPEFKPWEELQLMLAVGIVEWQPDELKYGLYYFTSSFTADYVYRFSRRSAFTLGTDILYDGSIERAIKGIPPEEVTTWQKMYLGGHAGYQYNIDRLTLLFNLGVYFVQHTYDREFFFSRAGGRIRITDHLSAHICIKSRNGIRSDWIEWGMACSLKTR